jgi:signal transduction histidine kinase
VGVAVSLLHALTCLASASEPKRILFVFQHDSAIPANVELEQSARSMLNQQFGTGVEIYHEQLDSARLPEIQPQQIAWLRSKYAHHGIDVILFVGNTPTDVLPGVPVVYCGNAPSELRRESQFGRNSVAVWMKVDVARTIEAAKRLQPEARKVLVICGTSTWERAYALEAHEQLKPLEGATEFEYLEDSSIPELVARLSALPRTTIVLYLLYSRDPAGANYVPRDVASVLAKASNAPVYGTSDTYLGTGVVGRLVSESARFGELAATLALKILNGKKPEEITVSGEEASVYMFDWRQLRRWGFREQDLPPGSIVKFKTPSLWEHYKWQVVATVILLALESFLIVVLIANLRVRRRLEKSLKGLAGQLLHSQDEERRRMARDLHDGTAQDLAGISLCLGQVLEDPAWDLNGNRRLLEEAHVLSRKALQEVRSVSYALHPPMLDGTGLVPALRWYVDGLMKRTNLRILLDAPPRMEPLPEVDGTLFRIVQESMSNILRHSGADTAKVRVERDSKFVKMIIEDNGHGMGADALASADSGANLGVGIAGMRERVRQFRGKLEIHSGSAGTTVLVSVPIS